MTTSILKPVAGRLLISDPSLQDMYFRKSVILLAEHNDEGTFGLIINKPVEVDLHDVAAGFPRFEGRVFLGGPVKTDSLFMLHTRPDLLPESLKIIDGVFWGGDIDKIQEYLSDGRLGPDDIRFFIGYSGWAPGQLDQELESNSWIVSKTNRAQIIHREPESLWADLLRSLGGDYSLWANFPNDLTVN